MLRGSALALGAAAVYGCGVPVFAQSLVPSTSGLIRLSSNENPYGPCEYARKALANSVLSGNRYGNFADVEKLTATIAAAEGLTPQHVVITAGSGEALAMIAAAFARSGNVVSADNVFPILPRYAETLGARWVKVALDETATHDLQAMSSRIDGDTRITYVCNPNNPTGTYVAGGHLRPFCEAAAKKTLVCVDEAYMDFVDPKQQDSMIDLVRAGQNVVITRTFSKVYGMAGLRVGYALASPDAIKKLTAVRMSWPNPLSLQAALATFGNKEFVQSCRTKNVAARTYTEQELDRMGIRHSKSATNFLWFYPGKERIDLPAELRNRGVLISFRDKLEEDWARVSVGTLDEMKSFVAALRQVYAA